MKVLGEGVSGLAEQKTIRAEQNDHQNPARMMVTHGLEDCGRGRATTDQGGAGGTRKTELKTGRLKVL